MQKRKIGFHWLRLSKMIGEERVYNNVEASLTSLLSYIYSLPKTQRKYDITNDKFCFVDNYRYDSNEHCVELLIISAKHSYRAPLIDKDTVESRDNPKRINEGEQIKTHMLLKFMEDDAIVFLEMGLNILKMKNVVDYLNSFIRLNNTSSDETFDGLFSSEMMPRDDFNEVLNNMSRVVCAELFISKSLLGSDALNFCNITNDIQENLVLSLKSEKKRSIKDTICQIMTYFSGANSKINRVRIRGIMPNSNDSIIDTQFIIKKEYVEVEQNPDTGEFNSRDMFTQLRLLANDF